MYKRISLIPILLVSGALSAQNPTSSMAQAEGQGEPVRSELSSTLTTTAQESLKARNAERSLARVMASRVELGLDNQNSFLVRRIDNCEMGQTHTRTQQYYQGIKVWGGEVIAHTDVEGNALPMTAASKSGINLSVVPSLDSKAVMSLVSADLKPLAPYAYEPEVELVIYPEELNVPRSAMDRMYARDLDATAFAREVQRYVLAYHVHTQIESMVDTRHTDYMVDAKTGEILTKWDSLRTSDEIGTGASQYSGSVNIHTNLNGSNHELYDVYRAMNISTYNLNHATSGKGTLYTDADNAWGDGKNYPKGTGTSTTGPTGQTAAVDAHYGIEMTYDMYKNLFGRGGIDGNNKATYSRVHYSTSYDNAFWDDTCFCMTYGDGSSFKSLEALDVAGHEMSHGVCASTANLTYSGESGGLNEANSDIFGNMVELYAKNNFTLPLTVANTDGCWTVGEQLSSTPLRYMYKPSLDSSSPDVWSSTVGDLDVHYSSGPANRMFFFLSQGASNNSSTNYYSSYAPNGFAGIGPEKALRIWYRALATYMTSNTDYAAARTAALSAAGDLYGTSNVEYAAVQNAFGAIHVGALAPPIGVNVSINPTTATVLTGAIAQFTASVTGSTNTSVNWTATGGGTVTDTGLFTAPATPGTSIVKATSVADPTKSAEAIVTVRTDGGETDLILNGGFESGTPNWTGTAGLIGNWSSKSEPSYEGVNAAYFGGKGKTTTQTLYQTVSIPATATSAILSFYLHIDTAETTTSRVYDKLAVQVRDTAGTVLSTLATYTNLNKAGGYQLRTLDLGAYKGKTVRVHYNLTEDVSLQTSFLVDKVSLVIK